MAKDNKQKKPGKAPQMKAQAKAEAGMCNEVSQTSKPNNNC